MAVKPFSKDELNYFKFSSIVLDEFPKALRQTFISLWDSKVGVLPGYQLWDDSVVVRNMLLRSEGGKTDIPINKSIQDWDSTALFKATIFAKTFRLTSSTKTLAECYLKGRKPKPSPFHPTVNSPSGDQDETLTLAIDQLRLLRNTFCHAAGSRITKADFDQYVQLAKDAFIAANVPSMASIDAIGCLSEANFPTEKVYELNECIQKELQANNIFLQEEVIDNISDTAERQEAILSECLGIREAQETANEKLKKITSKLPGTGVEQSKLKNCLPEKLSSFVSRDAEVNSVCSFLIEKSCGVVSIVGPPGFGKSTIAVQVSHQLKEENIPVIFSYLSNTSTVPEVIRHLCHDIGVPPGEDPKSSLICWFGNIKGKVVLVMDNIEQLLEGNTRSEFTDLVLTLRKNSNQQIQILTTSTTVFSVSNLNEVENVHVGEMDNESSVELLKKCCRNEEVEDEYLNTLANLCGHVPIALCIAASRIHEFEDPAELITWLAKKPMQALKSSDRNEYVQNAIEMSFKKLDDEDKRAFVRLAVFDGDFNRDAAQEIIERDRYQTQDFLKNLVDRSLIQRTAVGRFVIHSLIRKFLIDYDELQYERPVAQELMVKHFLKLCQSWTAKYYSKDGSSDARELLKKDAHNVEEMLKFYQGVNLEQSIVESLLCSGIYRSSSRFFYNFIRGIFPQTVVRNFLEFCVELAKRENHIAIQINFQCLLSDQEGRKSAWKSSEYIKMVEEIKEAFDRNEENLKEDSATCSHFYYCYGRFLSRSDSTSSCPDPLKGANDYLEKSLRLRGSREENPVERADEAITLCQLGLVNKRRAKSDEKTYESRMTCAKKHYERALKSAKELLGDHEVTSTCYKVLGDLYLVWRRSEEALPYYKDAKDMYKKLGLDSSESMVYLLKNYGLCFFYIHRFDEAKELLNEAREVADKLAEGHTPCRAEVYFGIAQYIPFWKKVSYEEAAEYAGVALELKEFLNEGQIKRMKAIICKSKKYSD